MTYATFFRKLLGVSNHVPVRPSYNDNERPTLIGEKGGIRRRKGYYSSRYRTEYVKSDEIIYVGVSFLTRVDALFRSYPREEHDIIERLLRVFFLQMKDQSPKSFDEFLPQEMRLTIIEDFANQI